MTLRLGVIHAMEGLYHASIARSVTKADSTVRSGAPQRQKGLPVSGPAAYLAHMLQRPLSAGSIAPCLPTKADTLPSGEMWLHG